MERKIETLRSAYLASRSPTGKALGILCTRATLLDKFTMPHPTDPTPGARLTVEPTETLYEREEQAIGEAYRKWGATP